MEKYRLIYAGVAIVNLLIFIFFKIKRSIVGEIGFIILFFSC